MAEQFLAHVLTKVTVVGIFKISFSVMTLGLQSF